MHTLSLPQDGHYQQENCKLTKVCRVMTELFVCHGGVRHL